LSRHVSSRARLLSELPGILRWIVDGAVAYLREGLNPPPEVARDIGAPTMESLARLLWVLNADRQGTRAKVEARYAVLIADAIGLLGTTPAT
jgi:hypothetical protein